MPLDDKQVLRFVNKAQQCWNSGELERVTELFNPQGEWWNRQQYLRGIPDISISLQYKRQRELHYRVNSGLWNHSHGRLSLWFVSEWQHAGSGLWYRTRGGALVKLDREGLIRQLLVAANDLPISACERSLVFDHR